MAKIGLKYPVYAIATDNGSAISYSGGAVMGKAISAKISVTTTKGRLYADDATAESDNTFSTGTISINTDDLLDSVKVDLLGYVEGAEVDAAIGSKELSTAGAEPPYVGVGFYGRCKRNGAYRWRAVWVKKVQFSEPADENTTKGEKLEFGTPTIEGDIMGASWDSSYWKDEATFSTEAGAVAWLDGKAGIGSGAAGGLTDLTLSAGTLTPTFAGTTKNYYATLSGGTTTFTATFEAGTAKLYVDGAYVETLTSSVASGAVAVTDDVPKLVEIVQREAGKTEAKYNVLAYYNAQ